MAQVFEPRVDILPAAQRLLWNELSSIPAQFTLYGGTALALHLGHRQSVDFDFFGTSGFDAPDLLSSLPFLAGAQILQFAPSTLTCAVNRDGPVKISFFGLPHLKRLAPPIDTSTDGLRIAALPDLAGTKISVLQMRAEVKDYLDIDALLGDGHMSLADILACADAIYGDQFNAQNALKALSYFDDGDVSSLSKQARDRLKRAVGAVALDRLPPLADILARHA